MKKYLVLLTLLALMPQTSLAIDTVGDLGAALDLNKDKVHIISREEWGADESIRFYKEEIENPPVIELSEELKEKYADEIKIRKKIIKQEGKTLIWPLEYAGKVTKFIIHHTATDIQKSEPIQKIKDIYQYHAIYRGWGDIGYNYIIDQNGQIYEGRAGGEGVVGGHAGPGNIGSIGIAVLGTYSDDKVPQKVVSSLIKLIAEKAKIHDIDADGYKSFRGEILPNIIGHRDIMNTDCPGDKLYTLFPVIRVLAAQLAGTTTFSNISRLQANKGYNFKDKSNLMFVEMQPGEEEEIIVRFENTGEKEWGKDTFITVNKNPAFENVVSFPDKEGAVLAKMQEISVKKGETATFKFKIKTELKSDLVYLNIAPVVDAKTKLSKYLVLPVLVSNADYSYEIVDSMFPPAFMKAGKKFEGWVDIKNIGNVTWYGNGKNRVTLGTSHEQDRVSEFADPKGARLGYLMNEKVAPGETGRFLLRLQAPKKAGSYEEYFTPVMEGITWFDDQKTSFRTLVYEKEYDASLQSSAPSKQIETGTTRTMWIKLRNVGGKAWQKEDFNYVLRTSKEINIDNVGLQEDTVPPGEIGTITFTVEAPNKTGKIHAYIRPRIDKYNITKQSIKFPLTIIKKSITNTRNGNDIRVKLSFEGDPEITANGNFSVFSGNEKLTELKAGEKAKVAKNGLKYEIEIDGQVTLQVQNEVRFVPVGKSIMEIANYDNSPSWSKTINDNRYRGTLEVVLDSGELIVINELPLEDYLKGLAENANDEYEEKMKALLVLARSYAYYYMTQDQKFPGKPYHLDDDPAYSQLYLGYGYEQRSPNNAKAVLATRGRVVKYDGKVIKTPYFSQSDGRTRSGEEVFGWTHTPYLQGVEDPYCEGMELRGHGVGMSGCGARGMAKAEKSYQEIIKYYFKDVVVSKIY